MLWRGRATVPRRCAHQEYASDSSRGFLIDAPAKASFSYSVFVRPIRDAGFDQPDAFGKRHLFGRDVVMIFAFGLMNVFWVVEAPFQSRLSTLAHSPILFNLDRLGGTPPALGRVPLSSSVTALASRCSASSLPSRFLASLLREDFLVTATI